MTDVSLSGMEKDEVFLLGVLSYVVGVAAGSFFHVSLPLLLLLGAFFVAIGVVFRSHVALWIVLFVVLFGGGAAFTEQERSAFATLSDIQEVVTGRARVLVDTEERDFYRQAILRFESCLSDNCPDTKVLWQAPFSVRVSAGMLVDLECRLVLPKNFDEAFDYRMFLAKEGIGYLCVEATRVEVVPIDTPGRIRSALYVPRRALERALSATISEPEAGLAKGLLLGGDNYLPRALKESFTRVGLSHMVAVSGYNITIIAELILCVGLLVGLWRKQAVWTALVGIVFFIIMIGMPASAARAGTMAGIVFVALQVGRLAHPTHVLLFALGAMLCFHPLLLRYDLGFQLSFLATLGILLLVPLYEPLAPQHWLLAKAGEILVMTLAAELFVLPLILFSFHAISPLILIGNFLVLLVPLSMGLAFLSAVLFLLVPGSEHAVSWAAYGVLTGITRTVEWLGSLNEASLAVPHFGIEHLVVWYVILGVGIFFVVKRQTVKRYEKMV